MPEDLLGFDDPEHALPDWAGTKEQEAHHTSAGDPLIQLCAAEIVFINAILDGSTQAEAYSISHPTYNGRNAGVLGYNYAAKPGVRAAINRAMDERTALAGQHASKNVLRVLDELMRIAFFDPAKLFDNTGRPKPISEIDQDTRAAIVGLSVLDEFEGRGQDRQQIGTVKQYKIADKRKALDTMVRMLGLLVDRTEVTGKDGKDLVPSGDERDVARRIAFLLQKAAAEKA